MMSDENERGFGANDEASDRQRARNRHTGSGVRRDRIRRPTPARQRDNVLTEPTVESAYDSNEKTIDVQEILDKNISVLKNGYPNYGLRNRDLKVLEGYTSDAEFINIILSALTPYVELYLLPQDVNGDPIDATDQTNETFTPESSEVSFGNSFFSNDEIMESISNPVPQDEIGFLTWGRNKISIASLNITSEEQTGMYSVKRFTFSFVIHKATLFNRDELLRSIFNPYRKFVLKWGYNVDMTNQELLTHAQRINKILSGNANRETIIFSTWAIKAEDSDHNIAVEAQAIPVSSKSFVTIKMGEHLLGAESTSALQEYDETLSRTPESESRAAEKFRNNIQGKINSIIVDAFHKSWAKMTKNQSDVIFSDILNEIAACVNSSLKKKQPNSRFQFVCGRFNKTLNLTSDDEKLIMNFKINSENFKNFNMKIQKDKNIPTPLTYLDQVISEFLSDYEDFRFSGDINTALNEKTNQENAMRKLTASSDSQKVKEASDALQEIQNRLQMIMLPTIKFFTHEHVDENNNTIFYCFVIDSSYGTPNLGTPIGTTDDRTAFQRVVESNAETGELLESLSIEDADFLVGQEDMSSESGVIPTGFDVPIIDIFSENTILNNFSLGSETDEELQASIIKRAYDKDAQSEQGIENPAATDWFKFLTTKVSFKVFGTNAFVPYQSIFFRMYGFDNGNDSNNGTNTSIFERMYNIIKISDQIEPGSWKTDIETVMQAI